MSPRSRNPYSKYSQRKARNEAYNKYQNGTQEYRDSIDEIGCVFWGVLILICILIFFAIAYFKGVDSAVDWVK